MWSTRPQQSYESQGLNIVQLYGAVGKSVETTNYLKPAAELDEMGYVNQHGLGRKVDGSVSFAVSCLVTPLH